MPVEMVDRWMLQIETWVQLFSKSEVFGFRFEQGF